MRQIFQRPNPTLVANVAALTALGRVTDGRLAQLPGLPTLAYHAALGDWVPADLHPRYGSYTLVSSIPDFGAVDQLVALASFVANTSEHSLSVGGTVYGPAQGATEQAALAALHALVVVGAEAGYSAAVEGTGEAARLRVASGSDILPATGTTVAPDLPTGWSLIVAEAGNARITLANGLELWSGVGAAVTASSSIRLQRTLGAGDRTVVVVRHAAAADGGLANVGANNLLFGVDWRMNGIRHVYTPSGSNGGAAGTAAIRPTTTGTAPTGSTGSSPRTEVWDVMTTEWGTTATSGRWVKRLGARESVQSMFTNSLLTADAGDNRVQWVAGNANAASTAIVKLYVRSVHVLAMP
jgi:hypothetical protein